MDFKIHESDMNFLEDQVARARIVYGGGDHGLEGLLGALYERYMEHAVPGYQQNELSVCIHDVRSAPEQGLWLGVSINKARSTQDNEFLDRHERRALVDAGFDPLEMQIAGQVSHTLGVIDEFDAKIAITKLAAALDPTINIPEGPRMVMLDYTEWKSRWLTRNIISRSYEHWEEFNNGVDQTVQRLRNSAALKVLFSEISKQAPKEGDAGLPPVNPGDVLVEPLTIDDAINWQTYNQLPFDITYPHHVVGVPDRIPALKLKERLARRFPGLDITHSSEAKVSGLAITSNIAGAVAVANLERLLEVRVTIGDDFRCQLTPQTYQFTALVDAASGEKTLTTLAKGGAAVFQSALLHFETSSQIPEILTGTMISTLKKMFDERAVIELLSHDATRAFRRTPMSLGALMLSLAEFHIAREETTRFAAYLAQPVPEAVQLKKFFDDLKTYLSAVGMMCRTIDTAFSCESTDAQIIELRSAIASYKRDSAEGS